MYSINENYSKVSWMAITAVSLSIVIAMLDSTIANVALPVIARDFQVSASASIVIVNAYQFAVVAALVPLAALGKKLGNKSVFETGVLLFAISSLGCAISDTLNMLTIFRVIQGFGAAAILSVNAALIKEIYPEKLLGRGLAINVMIVSVSAAAGPSIAAAIMSMASWNCLFTINVPIAIVSLLLSMLYLNKQPIQRTRFDISGAMLVFTLTIFLACFVLGMTRENILMALCGTVGSVTMLLWLFDNQRRKMNQALIPLSVFADRTFSLSLMMSTLSYCTQLLAYVSLPFYFHNILHRDVVQVGLLLTAWPLATTITSLVAGELLKRHNPNVIASLGLGMLVCGMVTMTVLPASPGNFDIIWRVALCGAGFGLFQSPNNYLIMTSVANENVSVASGLLGSSRLIGQIIGSAMVAIYLNISEAHGITLSLITGACFSLFSLLVSYVRYMTGKRNGSG
ncbi:MFS transporter [Pantoea sp. EA-12]|uniref:MFS transporter n=1 Tax=Pantoea sp. EA-12 TaxID=3043303 RepID=UPI0024B4BBE9|nr:MFS transporter [Pantoea sp. EA-12]MDI9222110.1 MFS transporter [Pantoea sp. EA-12]